MPEQQTDFELSELNPDDYDQMIELWNRAGLPVRASGRDSRIAFAWQAERGLQRVVGVRTSSGRLVALAVLTHDGRKGWINRLAVDPEYRRRGLARRLVAEAERWFLEEAGVDVWAALIENHNEASKALFAALGFRTLDVAYVAKRTHDGA